MAVIRKYNARTDLKHTARMIREYLLPFTRQTKPDFSLDNEDIRQRLRHGVTFVDTNSSGKPCGFIQCEAVNDRLWIHLLAVDESYREKGRGRKLMQMAERYGRSSGCQWSCLFVDFDNTRAQRFYESLGYSYASTEPSIRCFLYAKPLEHRV